MGEALAIVVMVIQVAGSGGTFPIEALPQVFQWIYPFLPFQFGMKAFTQPLHDLSEYDQIVSDLAGQRTPIHIDGCIDSQKCHLISSIGEPYPFKLIVTYNEIKAKEIYEDYRFFDRNVYYYPAKDIIFYNADIHSNLIVSQRMAVIRRMMDGCPVTVVTTIDGLSDRLLPLEELQKNRCVLRWEIFCIGSTQQEIDDAWV